MPPDPAAVAQLCSCAAAIAVRTAGGMRDLVGSSHGALVALRNVSSRSPPAGLSPQASLRVLSCLPGEADASDRTAKELDEEMAGCVSAVLDAVGSVLNPLAGSAGGTPSLGEAEVVVALKVLGNWIQRCRITLSQLNTGGETSLLAVLVTVLSQPQPTSEDVLSSASLALSNAVLDPPDGLSEARRTAVAVLLRSIQSGFLVAPFTYASAHEWDDGAHGLATLAGALACEEMETVAVCQLPGCPELIELLLRITAHPARSVAVQALEGWLTLQDIPTTERHPDAAAPLFGRIVDILIPRVAYTDSFTVWEDEDELDPQEFAEMRRMVSDVLVSAYFLLRVDYVDRIVAAIKKDPSRWAVTESALFGLTAPSREICARVKARAGGQSVAADKEATAARLVQLASELCTGGADAAAGQHGLVLSAVATFVGSFAPVWNVRCAPEALLDMLAYLMDAMRHPAAAAAAAKSTRQIFVGCSGKLAPLAEGLAAGGDAVANPLAKCLAGAMETSLASGGEEGKNIIFIAEGSTRLCMQIKDVGVLRQVLCITVTPVLRALQHALDAVRTAGDGNGAAAAQLELSCQGVATCLRVLREVVRFCDEPKSSDETYHLNDVLNALWPLLNDVVSTPACRQHAGVLSELLNVHGQLLSNAKQIVAPHFSALVTFVVQSFEETHLPCALDYVAAAVEAFGEDGADTEHSFSQLLAHLSQCACAYVTQEKRPNECPEVIKALFEMTQRYLLFCPQALVACSEFSTLFSLAVACLHECKGERESTRATLNFLAQTIGWKSLRLSPSANSALEAGSAIISISVFHHGEVVTKACVTALSGGAPQMLWPAYSDALFALVSHVVGSSESPTNGDEVAHQWMTSALSDDSASVSGVVLPSETKSAVTHFLFGLAKEGPKSKPRAKMLLGDFGKICKGEATADVLVAYSLD